MSRGVMVALALAGVIALAAILVLMSRSDVLPWEHDYATALAHAKERNQTVVAYLHTDWCTYCKRMEAETFPSEQIRRAAEQYVWLELNPEKDQDGAQLRQQYRVSGYPTFLFLDGSGARLGQVEGFMPPEAFVQTLAAVSTRRNSLEALKEQVRQQPSSVEARYKLAQTHFEMKNYREAATEFEKVIQADPGDHSAKSELAHYHLALSLASSGEYSRAEEQLAVLAAKFPDGKLAPQATILHGQVFYHQGDTGKARASLAQFLQKYPTHENAALVRRMLTEIGPELPLSASH